MCGLLRLEWMSDGGSEYSVAIADGAAVVGVRRRGEEDARRFRAAARIAADIGGALEKYGVSRRDGPVGTGAEACGKPLRLRAIFDDGATVAVREGESLPENYRKALDEAEKTVLAAAKDHLPDYGELCGWCEALTGGVPYGTANLANVSALIYGALGDVNWAGFYLAEDGKLILGPFQGKPACIELKIGADAGVCGTAAFRDETVVVYDVHEFKGHIACDADSASEIVIPLHKDGRVIGVLDIDSPVKGRFSDSDRAGLERIARITEAAL